MFDRYYGVGLGNFFDPNDLSKQKTGRGDMFVSAEDTRPYLVNDMSQKTPLNGGAVGIGTNPRPSAPQPDTAPPEPAKVSGIDRSRFAQELKDNPALRQKIMAIAAGENLDPTANQAVLETMMNRAAMSGTSLAAQATLHKSSGINEHGYYAGYNPKALKRPKIASMIESNLDKVLAGSNVSNLATDNASGSFAEKQRRTGAFNYRSDYGGETFFSPGKAGGSGSRGEKAYQRWVQNIGSPDPTPVDVASKGNSGSNRMSDQDYRNAFPNAPRLDTSKVQVASNQPSNSPNLTPGPRGLEGFTPGLGGRRPMGNPFAGIKAPQINVIPLTRGPVARAPQIVDPNTGLVVEDESLPMNWQG